MTDQVSPRPGLLSGRQTLNAAMRQLGCVLWCADVDANILELGEDASDLLTPRGLGALLATPCPIDRVLDKERVDDFKRAYRAYAAGESSTLDMTCLLYGRGGAQSLWRITGIRRQRRDDQTYIYGLLVPMQGAGPLNPVLDLIPQMIFMKDRHGRYLLANQSVIENYGKPLDQIVGRLQSDLQASSDEAAHMLADDQQTLGKGALHVDPAHTFTNAAGTPQVLHTTKLPYRPAEQDEPVVLGVSIDITEQKRAEEELRASEERFRLLADNVPGVIYLCHNDARYSMMYLNDAIEKLSGYPKEEFLSDRVSFVDLYHPNDAARVTTQVNEALRSGHSFELEYRLRHKNGSYRWVREVGVGVQRDGQLAFLEGFILDITQYRRTLDALEAAHAQLAARVERNTAELEDTTEQLHLRTSERNAVEASLNRQLEADRQFYAALKSLNEIGHVLAEVHTCDEIARLAVELGLSRLGIGRMSLWLRDFDADGYVTTGTYGTDEHGRMRDERYARLTISDTSPVGLVLGQRTTLWRDRDVPLFNHHHEMVGRGERVVAALWDGERVIGTIATDTLTLGRNYPERMVEIIQLYGTTIAHHFARVRNIAALQESAIKLNRITTAMPGAVYQFQRDASGDMRFTYISDIIEDLCEVPASAFLSDINVAIDMMLPEYRPSFHQSVEQSTASLEPWSMDYRIRTPSGKVRWMRGSSIPEPRKPDGSVVWNGMIIDITDRKNAELALQEKEERHRSLIAALGEGIILVNPDGTVREANRAAERMFGLLKDQMSERGHDRSLVTLRDETGRVLPFEAWPAIYTFNTGKALTDTIVQIITTERPDGIWVSVNTQPMLRHGERKPFAVVASLRDITEQRRIEAERRQFESELQQAQRIETVGELAGGIAHDFNNLLTAIFSYTENAKSTLSPQDAAYQSILRAEHVAHEARTITTSLLTFCRKSASIREPVRINDAITESIRMVGHMRKHSVVIQTQLDRTQSLCVMADPTQLRQMMINLMINAIDAMPEGGTLRVEGASRATDAGALVACISFADTGGGIAEADLQRIFEPFFTTRPRGRGTGLGLAIVHGIVRSLSGEISVASTLGKGTTMTVELPAFHRAAEQPCDATPSTAPGKVVVLTHDAFVRNMLRSWLRRKSFEVLTLPVEDDSALADARVVIVDLGDAAHDASASLRDIHQRLPRTPILLLGDQSGRDSLPGDVAVHVLRKPYKMKELIELVTGTTASEEGGGI